MPKLVSLFIKNTQNLPKQTRVDILTPGAQVELRIRATVEDYDVEVLSAVVQKSTSARDFLRSVNGIIPNLPSKGKKR